MKKFLLFTVLCLRFASPSFAADKDPELSQFEGRWQVIQLAEDGHVIPREAIPEWLPSGGRLEIADSAIMFTSPQDGKKHVKVFAIDATQYPKGIDLITREKKEAQGIYRFDQGKLIVCLSGTTDGPRPTEFSAKAGSKQMLMVLEPIRSARTAEKLSPVPANPPMSTSSGTTAKVLSDTEATKLLQGTWRFKDDAGALIITLASDGTWSTIRESQELRLFQKVFVRTPLSSGKWSVQNGTLTFYCTASIYLNRVNQQLPFTIRSISGSDVIFVDYMGRLGKAIKIR